MRRLPAGACMAHSSAGGRPVTRCHADSGVHAAARQKQRPAQHMHHMLLLLILALPLCCARVAQAMRVMNQRMNLPNMQKILMEFEKQNERMEMTSDMMGDAIDDAMEVSAAPGAPSERRHACCLCPRLLVAARHAGRTAAAGSGLAARACSSRLQPRRCWVWLAGLDGFV